MTPVEILTKAREYITPIEHWCTDLRWSYNGKKNCALGALERAYGMTDFGYLPDGSTVDDHIEVKYLGQAGASLFPSRRKCDDAATVAVINNRLGHKATLQMFDAAIELAKKNIEI